MDIALTDNLDIDLGDNYTMYLSPVKEKLVKQQIAITLNTNRGEWLYDTSFGTPWFTNQYNKISILSKVPQAVINAEIKASISYSPLVLNIDKFTVNRDLSSRVCTINALVTTDSGELIQINTTV